MEFNLIYLWKPAMKTRSNCRFNGGILEPKIINKSLFGFAKTQRQFVM